MAYVTGTANSFTDLLTALRNACTNYQHAIHWRRWAIASSAILTYPRLHIASTLMQNFPAQRPAIRRAGIAQGSE